MDTKSLNVLATELTLLQIQLNAALLLLQAQHPTVPILERFRRLVDEGVGIAGLEAMQRMEDRLRDGIVFLDLKEMGLDDLWRPGRRSYCRRKRVLAWSAQALHWTRQSLITSGTPRQSAVPI